MASETLKQYEQRLLSYLGKQDPFKVLKATPGKLERMLKGISRKKLTQRPSTKKWSIAEIVAHLTDVELVMGWRYRSIIARPGAKMIAFEQDDWAEAFHYNRQNVSKTLPLFRSLRDSNLQIFQSVSTKKLSSAYGIHEERGKLKLTDYIAQMAGHDINHLMQIKKLLQ